MRDLPRPSNDSRGFDHLTARLFAALAFLNAHFHVEVRIERLAILPHIVCTRRRRPQLTMASELFRDSISDESAEFRTVSGDLGWRTYWALPWAAWVRQCWNALLHALAQSPQVSQQVLQAVSSGDRLPLEGCWVAA